MLGIKILIHFEEGTDSDICFLSTYFCFFTLMMYHQVINICILFGENKIGDDEFYFSARILYDFLLYLSRLGIWSLLLQV